jgi:Pectate lyase superfamily protein
MKLGPAAKAQTEFGRISAQSNGQRRRIHSVAREQRARQHPNESPQVALTSELMKKLRTVGMLFAGIASFLTIGCDTGQASGTMYANVRDFGAIGNGVADDTASIKAAIASLPPFDPKHPFTVKPVFFPSGTYLVDDTIERISPDGRRAPALALIGESRNSVTLRLADASPGFDDPKHPKSLLTFSSGLLASSPTLGGRDYIGKGEGNDGYQNYLTDMTVDVGRGNPGAVAVDYLANNIGAIRNVAIRASGGRGSTALSMTRKWIGPGLVQNVDIDGYETGIDIANTEYSVVLDRVKISGSRQFGLRNTSNSVSFSDLGITPLSGIALANMTPMALLVGTQLRIEGNSASKLVNQGYLNLTGVAESPATVGLGLEPESGTNTLGGVVSPSGRLGQAGWRLPIKRPPTFPTLDETQIADAAASGAVGDGKTDDTRAIQSALASGRPVLRLANGIYRISAPIEIPATVTQVEGSFATLVPDFRIPLPQMTAQPERAAVLVTGPRSKPLRIRQLIFDNARSTARIAVLHGANAELVLSDIAAGGIGALVRPASGGEVWADNMLGGGFSFAGKAGVWIRSLNTEGKMIRIKNDGAPLWILGTKTEQNMTLLDNSNGAETELMGGLAYMVHRDGDHRPYIQNLDGHVTASLAEEAFQADPVYETWLQSVAAGKERLVKATDLPIRHHFGRMVPQITSD